MNPADLKQSVQPRRAVLEMPEYHPPLAGRDGLRLDFNENTLAPSPRVAERLRQINTDDMTRYPERGPVEQVVAEYFGLTPGEVLLTNGVDEAIHLVCETFLEPEDEALIAVPTFFMYEVYAAATGAKARHVQADDSLQFPIENFLAAINERTRLIAIASPNNPTGAVVERAALLRIAQAAPQAVVLIDEAYYHFYGESMMNDLRTQTNIVIARTFSKAYGLAGLRIGLLAGDESLMRHIRKVSSPYNVNAIALDCLPIALEDTEYIAWYAEQIHTNRKLMEKTLTEIGMRYWHSHANFVLFHLGPLHKEFVQAMRRHSVLVRDRSNDPGCDGNVRITIGPKDHTARGISAMLASLEEIGWRKSDG
jgi:histidinol-phosphate aminotransferase